MNAPSPRDPGFAARVRASFSRQAFMGLLGATLLDVAPGRVRIAVALRPALSQQHGFAHAGVAWSIADSAAGYAAQSLMGPTDGVLTVELKINLLAPAAGDRLVATGVVERAGRRLTVCRADVVAEGPDGPRAVALATGTFMAMADMPDAAPAAG